MPPRRSQDMRLKNNLKKKIILQITIVIPMKSNEKKVNRKTKEIPKHSASAICISWIFYLVLISYIDCSITWNFATRFALSNKSNATEVDFGKVGFSECSDLIHWSSLKQFIQISPLELPKTCCQQLASLWINNSKHFHYVKFLKFL